MGKSLLHHKYEGKLTVVIKNVGDWTLDFQKEILGFQSTLFDYVGQACAILCTNLTTRLQIKTRLEDWQVIRFSPKKKILEVIQVGGEEIFTPEDDDSMKLGRITEGIEYARFMRKLEKERSN